MGNSQRTASPERIFPGDAVAVLTGERPKAHKEFGRRIRLSGSTDYLRAGRQPPVSRQHLLHRCKLVTMGPHIGQVGLQFANDMGSVMMEENVVSSAGTTYCLDEAVLLSSSATPASPRPAEQHLRHPLHQARRRRPLTRK